MHAEYLLFNLVIAAPPLVLARREGSGMAGRGWDALRALFAMAVPFVVWDALVAGRHWHFNPDYVQSLSLGELEFALCHEALHCALSHFARRQHRVKARWDLACDYAINPLLRDEGLSAPPDALFDERFDDRGTRTHDRVVRVPAATSGL